MNWELKWSSTKQFSQIRMSLLNKFSIKDFILSSKEAYQNELKNKGVGSDIGQSLLNKFSITEINNAIGSVNDWEYY